jgi:hypothetical protein
LTKTPLTSFNLVRGDQFRETSLAELALFSRFVGQIISFLHKI